MCIRDSLKPIHLCYSFIDRIDEAEKGASMEPLGRDERVSDHGEVRSINHGIAIDEEQLLLVRITHYRSYHG